MNVLINFSTLKKGGGQNVGLNFISSLLQIENILHTFYFIVADNSAIFKYLKERQCKKYIVAPENPIARIFFELSYARNFIRKNNIQIIYSYFGYGLFPSKIPQISGAADSNLIHPEVNFWKGYGGLSLLKKKVVDKYRLWGLKKVKGIIFENKALENRFHELYRSHVATITILPSINLSYPRTKYFLKEVRQDTKKGLFLCGWHLNKNVLMIPKLAHQLKQKGVKFRFILTAPKDNSVMHRQFQVLINHYNVDDYIDITGPVRKDELYSLYQQMDVVFLLSKLESFSNNIIEAWSFHKPLIITEAEWSRSICKDAAVYVERDDVDDIVKHLILILSDNVQYKNVITNGIENLRCYPNIEEKTKQELAFVETVYEKSI